MGKNDIKCWVLQNKSSGRFVTGSVYAVGCSSLGKARVYWSRGEARANLFAGERVVKVIATLRLAKKGE